ncbi:MAG TPA: thioredoxin domain-containing protein [Patescibacteria group bacterium]|nr:thioredoxin domain-containing protein [Patescibacteria group bacterium]
MSKKFWILLSVLVIALGFIWLSNDHNKTAKNTTAGGTITTHITGKPGAKVTLVEYSDFQCSYCKMYFPVVEQVIAKYQDRISFEYRQYPLTTIHRNAFAASRAAEAASKQGKFWEMYRLLFVNQSAWENSGSSQSTFEGYANQLGLNAATFKTDFTSSATNATINASIEEFNKRGLPTATPTFLLNNKKIDPRATVEDFSKLIDEQLKNTPQ